MTDSKSGDRGYKRSWKNLLINKRYQLRFTLFMVGLSSLLMVGLGVWVMRVANETTTVSMASVRGEACPRPRALSAQGRDEAADKNDKNDKADRPDKGEAPPDSATDAPPPAAAQAPVPAATGSAAPTGEPTGSGSAGAGSDDDHRTAVQIDESTMTLTPPPAVRIQPLPSDLADQLAAHYMCELRQVGRFDRLERGRLRILWAMIGTGIVLVIGLAFYGIKMTHRVAGPLFKVGLYLSKMRQGRFDTVYNLRKGDQLVEFYDHFKLAHGGVVAMQRADIERASAVIAAAEAAGAGSDPAIVELRALVARKEKSVE